jgi:hypothetical protein
MKDAQNERFLKRNQPHAYARLKPATTESNATEPSELLHLVAGVFFVVVSFIGQSLWLPTSTVSSTGTAPAL